MHAPSPESCYYIDTSSLNPRLLVLKARQGESILGKASPGRNVILRKTIAADHLRVDDVDLDFEKEMEKKSRPETGIA